MTIEIRPVAPEDRARWGALWQGYLSFCDTVLPQEICDRTFARLLDPQCSLHGLLAWRDGEAVGLVHYLFHARGCYDADACVLQDLFTAPHARGTGIGRALTGAVRDLAETSGAAQICGMTRPGTDTAQARLTPRAAKTDFIICEMEKP